MIGVIRVQLHKMTLIAQDCIIPAAAMDLHLKNLRKKRHMAWNVPDQKVYPEPAERAPEHRGGDIGEIHFCL